MKIIVSHDVDYITVWEHKDLSVPKFLFRTFVEALIINSIGLVEVKNRVREFRLNRWHNLPEIVSFDLSQNIPSTFFFGVEKGLGLCYKNAVAKLWIDFVKKKGFSVGLHGINWKNESIMLEEKRKFEVLSGFREFGVRIHYLRADKNTLHILERLGYKYDSSFMRLKNPYKVGKLWEFPISLMDTYIFNENKFWQVLKFEQAKTQTLRILDRALSRGLQYFVILFHDNRFSDSYKDAKKWYEWLIEYLKENDFEFIDFHQAIATLEKR